MEPIKGFAVLNDKHEVIVSGNAQYAIVGVPENGELFLDYKSTVPVIVLEDKSSSEIHKGEIRFVNNGKSLLIDLVGLAEADNVVDKLESIYQILKAVRDGRDALKAKA